MSFLRLHRYSLCGKRASFPKPTKRPSGLNIPAKRPDDLRLPALGRQPFLFEYTMRSPSHFRFRSPWEVPVGGSFKILLPGYIMPFAL